jgi:hypothetical protein
MTVSSSTNRVSYSGNGTLTVFAYTFKVFDESDLTVILRASDGTETVQTITTHYTVSGVGDVGGGNVTFVTAPTATQTVVILREQPLTQGLDLVPNDPFPAESLEESFDKLTFMVQQHEEELGRAIKASRTNTITTTEFVESASDRANKVIAFDGSGDLDLTQEIGTFRGNWAASTAYAVRDIVKDTNNNNIYIANTAHTSSGTVPLTGNADIAKWDLLVDAAAATTSANNAATSATAAATSATAAATSATAAATSESNAATSASNASTSETNAAASATNAATSESNAAGSESAAATSESNAATSATNASTSASAAATSATNAATSETAAAASQAAAATSETNAATSATSAATNATNAATSASNASTAQTAAETAQTAAEAAQAAAELAADNFDDTYLGSKSSDPTVDNDGGALNAGDLYFNTTSNTLKVYSGSAWQDAAVDSSGFVQTTGDTMTGDLDIQGTLTSDGLTVAGANSALVSIVAPTDNATLEIRGGNSDAGVEEANVVFYQNNAGKWQLGNATDNSFKLYNYAVSNYALTVDSNNDISFYEDTGTTAKLHWSAADERLGIGTGSPASALHLESDTPVITLRDTSAYSAGTGPYIQFQGLDSGSTNRVFGQIYGLSNGSNSGELAFYTRNSGSTAERMRIDSSGNVGIGTSSPASVGVAGMPALSLMSTTSGRSGGLYWQDTGGTTVANSYFFGSVFNLGTETSHPFAFRTGGSERMRIDSSGNLLVGKTSSSFSTVGARLSSTDNQFVTDGQLSAAFNRKTSDGEIIGFFKDGTVVGSIGVNSNRFEFANKVDANKAGLSFHDRIAPMKNGSTSDNQIDLGEPSIRFDDIYATNGTIQTSDENEKQQIASLTDAEMAAAKAISKLFKTFKWNDSVAEKGDAARTHSGVIAQDVEQAMTDAGLNAGDYAFFISTTWWETQTEVPAVEADEENGVEAQEAYTRTDTYETAEEAPEGATERNRKGIRYPQLLSFIGAATEQRLASIESRLDALEA